VSRFSIVLPDSQGLDDGGGAFRVAVSPDGRTVVYVGRGTVLTGSRLWVRSLDQLRATPLAGTEGAINPSFSPDGKRVAFVTTAPRGVRTVALIGGPPTTLTDSLVDLGGLSWGTDGYVYFDGHLEGDGIARVRETGGRPEIATKPGTTRVGLFHMNPAALPDGRGVLFTAAVGGGNAAYDVHVLDTRTGTEKFLVHGMLGRYAASGHLVYVTDAGTMMAAPFDLNRLEITGDAMPVIDGVSVRALSRADVAISTSGLLVYAAGAGQGAEREYVWVTRVGVATPVDPQWIGRFAGRPRLSPDGRSVAVGVNRGSAREVWIKQLDRGPASKLTEDGAAPSWTPDGRDIVFRASRGMWRGPADGSRLPTAFVSLHGVFNSPEMTRDGNWIVFVRLGDLFAVRTSGDTVEQPLVVSPNVETSPTVSTDGRWLAYASDETGRLEVYVRPFPDTKTAKRPVSTGGGVLPRWSRDGRELFFIDEQGDLIAVPVQGGAAFTAGSPKRLFSLEPYNPFVSPFEVGVDGSRFLMTRNVGGATIQSDELVIVQNFFEELKAKAPPK
jgi:serine/threonine-protein kinase